MGGLIKAEFRKILTTKMWWALLIPAALVALVASGFGSVLGGLEDVLRESGQKVPIAVLFYARGMNQATLFAAIFGACAVAGEFRTKTITTTYLTASSRTAVIGAKLIAYAGMGVVYGIGCAISGSIGAVIGDSIASDGTGAFPDLGAWLAICAAGIGVMVLWTLLGVGVGTLINNPVGSILALTLYVLVAEKAVELVLSTQKLDEIRPYLPNNAGNGVLTDLSLRIFVKALTGIPVSTEQAVDLLRQQMQVHTDIWWASALVFFGYFGVVTVLGWLLNEKRDVT
ncbi:ABC transporter permease [Pseudonocardiaceae bacterium YIM PH 21723]|nr:ABC transporter permease [Pseudonocardiaceae bacterium YIM PH 21723]